MVVDGICKCLNRADIEAFKKMKNINEVEKMISDAWECMNAAVAAGNLSQDQGFAIFGKFIVRVTLKSLKKEKVGMEGKSYESLDAIQTVFQTDLGSKNVTSLASSSGSSQPSSQSEVLSLKDTSSPAWIASQKGFVVGKMFSYNGAFPAPVDDHELVVCSITSLAIDGIHLKEVSPFTQKPRQYVVEYANTDALSKYTGKPPVALPK
jgi:hypothetical protein